MISLFWFKSFNLIIAFDMLATFAKNPSKNSFRVFAFKGLGVSLGIYNWKSFALNYVSSFQVETFLKIIEIWMLE